jgi:hypothetical protein
VSMRIVPGCVRFLGEEKRFYTVWTQSGSGASLICCANFLPRLI